MKTVMMMKVLSNTDARADSNILLAGPKEHSQQIER